MGRCRFCLEPIPKGLDYCPNCYTSTQPTLQVKQEPISPFQEHLAKIKVEKSESRPIGSPFFVGCLALILLGGIGAIVLAVRAPDKIMALIVKEPTISFTPTPRPTPTSTPIPIPTPRWGTHYGLDASFNIKFPPNWVVIDMKHTRWEDAVSRESLDYPWLISQFPEQKQQWAAENGTLVAFDPQRKGRTMIQCWTRPELAGMTALEIRDALGEEIIERSSAEGGRVQGGVRTEILTIGEHQAASFEVVVLPGEDSTVGQPIKYWSISTADKSQGYWIEVTGIEQELTQDKALINAIFDTFTIFKIDNG
ncbi:MAG: hypothetical protein JXA42_08215 [Anaerolineales bacterium]|nr:hypothetical protein [Anaerolineales bacterium]